MSAEMSDDVGVEQAALEDEVWSQLHHWYLDTADQALPVLNEWDSRRIIPKYELHDPGLSLLARLGMPPVPLAAVIQPGREFSDKFTNYKVELLGIRGQLRRGRRDEQPDGVFEINDPDHIAPVYGVWEFPITKNEVVSWVTMSIHVWRMRLFARGVEAYIEQLWHTHQQRWLRVVFNMRTGHGSDILIDVAALKKLAEGLPLFNIVLQAVSLPRQSQKLYPFEDFKRDAYQAIEKLARLPERRGKKGKRRARRILAKEVLADRIGCAKQTLYDFINQNEGLWDHFCKLYEILKQEPQTSLSDALNRL